MLVFCCAYVAPFQGECGILPAPITKKVTRFFNTIQRDEDRKNTRRKPV
ncbi:hypothetical protein UYSO10_1410 [Kosakonia radicincitans]|nr:hypothetical protein UYSO10_1410 [Kosakonia radicincitans]